MRRPVKRHLARFGLLAGLTLTGAGLGRGADDPLDDRVYGPAEKVEGKTYAEWTARWFQWAFKIPKARNPVTDPDGSFAAEGQEGPVWFLGGNLGGKSVRKFEVPAGKPILTPVYYDFTNTAGDGAAAAAKLKERAEGRPLTLEVTLDGKPVTNVTRWQVATGAVRVLAPEKQTQALIPVLVPGGKGELVADGYWLLLKPLSPGEHVLQVKAQSGVGNGAFQLDITSRITVTRK